MGRAKGSCGIWRDASDEHPRQWAVRSEQQSQMPQMPIAQWVRIFFAIGGVVLPYETTAGIAAVARLADSQKSAATRPIIVSGCALS